MIREWGWVKFKDKNKHVKAKSDCKTQKLENGTI